MKILDLWDFPVTLYYNAQEKKCITIHVLLGNIRPRLRYRKMQILWSFQGARPLDLHQDSTMELLGAFSAPIHSNVLRNDRRSLHVVPTIWQASQTKRQKTVWLGGGGGGGTLIGLPPHQLHSHYATGQLWLEWHQIEIGPVRRKISWLTSWNKNYGYGENASGRLKPANSSSKLSNKGWQISNFTSSSVICMRDQTW